MIELINLFLKTKICIIVVLLILIFLLNRGKKPRKETMVSTYKVKRVKKSDKCDRKARKICEKTESSVPYNSSQFFINERQNGVYQMHPSENYQQITNNNLLAPNNLTCRNSMDQTETCLERDRINERCYTDNYNKCMGLSSSLFNR